MVPAALGGKLASTPPSEMLCLEFLQFNLQEKNKQQSYSLLSYNLNQKLNEEDDDK